jgi:hypothetical protein
MSSGLYLFGRWEISETDVLLTVHGGLRTNINSVKDPLNLKSVHFLRDTPLCVSGIVMHNQYQSQHNHLY